MITAHAVKEQNDENTHLRVQRGAECAPSEKPLKKTSPQQELQDVVAAQLHVSTHKKNSLRRKNTATHTRNYGATLQASIRQSTYTSAALDNQTCISTTESQSATSGHWPKKGDSRNAKTYMYLIVKGLQLIPHFKRTLPVQQHKIDLQLHRKVAKSRKANKVKISTLKELPVAVQEMQVAKQEKNGTSHMDTFYNYTHF